MFMSVSCGASVGNALVACCGTRRRRTMSMFAAVFVSVVVAGSDGGGRWKLRKCAPSVLEEMNLNKWPDMRQEPGHVGGDRWLPAKRVARQE